MSAVVLPSQQSASGGDAEMVYMTVSPEITAAASIAHPLALQRGLESIGEEGDTDYDSKLPADSSIASVSAATVPDSSNRLGPTGKHRLFLPDDDNEFFTAFAETLKGLSTNRCKVSMKRS